ncbi:MAG TPA: flagellar type III secretion system pore protein FliP [candidate division Zixibacteria bacterium]|nr:flagellar type III secretion system pore protein FliP [candidate division Zixibacteria bacterium]
MKKLITTSMLVLLALMLVPSSASPQTLPSVSVEVGKAEDSDSLSTTLQIVILMTVLALAPSILIMITSFIRIVVVLAFLRQAMGIQQMPPNQLLVSLALILTFFIMSPIIGDAYNNGIKPFMEDQISKEEAFDRAVDPFKKFMLAQTREKDLALFVNVAKLERPETAADVPLEVLVPGFVISELRTAFQIAFVLFIPFLVIDMVVASVLMSMGMMMLPPVIVSLPFKILLFVLVDGWYLLVKSLVESFHM